MRVVISDVAYADLMAITDYIADENPLRAESLLEDLLTRCFGLALNPRAFPVMERFRLKGFRRRAFQNYLIVYSVTDDVVTVAHVVHGARDLDTVLGD